MLVDEPFEQLASGLRDSPGHRQRGTAGEDREAGERQLYSTGEQRVAPDERRPRGALTSRCISRAGPEDRESAVQPRSEFLRPDGIRSCGGQLDRKWKPVQSEADLC